MAKIRRGDDIRSNALDKQAEKEKRSKVYTTEIIESIIKDLTGHLDLNPFWHGLLDYRDSGVPFAYTEWEQEELDKCSLDCLYFAEHYAKFKNDKGLTLVKLRDYQKRILKLLGEEIYDEEHDIIRPKNQKICLLQSRQTGKCVDIRQTVQLYGDIQENTVIGNIHLRSKYCITNLIGINICMDNAKQCENTYTTVPIYELYYGNIKNPKWYDILAYNILKHMPDNIFYNKILYILDSVKFGDTSQREKLAEIIPVNNIFLIKGCEANNHVTEIIRTKPYHVYKILLENGISLKCADNHIVCAWDLLATEAENDSIVSWISVDRLTHDHLVMTEKGWTRVDTVKKCGYDVYMADLSILEDSHDYFCNGVLSHNTTTVACYFAWVLTFHSHKTAFVSANKKDTGKEIIAKIKTVLEGMPFFMKPGILNVSDTRIKFENGSSLKCGAASKTPATGDSIQILYVDEAAVIAPNVIDEYWASVYPTMSSFAGHQMIMSSTPRGKGNLFYKTYTEGIPWNDPAAYLPENSKRFITSRVDWWEVPGRGPEWEAEQRADLGDEKFNREFGLSFEASNTRLINAWAIKFILRIKKMFISYDFYNIPNEVSNKIVWDPDFHPDQLTYNELLNNRFLFVIDTALGIESGAAGKKDADYNVINIFKIELLSPCKIEENRQHSLPIDVRNVILYKQVGVYLDNFKDEKECANAAKYLAFHVFKTGYGDIDNVRILIEMNFNGNNWMNAFKSHPSYYELLIIKTPNGINQQGYNIKYMLGYKTTSGGRGKTYYCELGEKMLRNRQILIMHDGIDPSHSSVYLIENFGKNKKNAYEGAACHDDLSITCLFVCIAGEQLYFRLWIEEWIEQMQPTYKVQKIQQMLEMYVETEEEISDDQFTNFYKMASLNFGKITRQNNGYGSLMNGGVPTSTNFARLPSHMGYSQQRQNMAAMSRFIK